MELDVFSSARAMVAALAARTISARELLDLHLARIGQVNGAVNALVSLDAERARDQAGRADDRAARGEPLGPLHGLPFAFKDTHQVSGWRTTFGSPLMVDHVPHRDDLVVERIRRAGAVPLAKTNVPEWAAGSHTFNPIFGTTRNPYDLTRSAGGSSGGAAAALAAGMVPLADGSDMGGSLRNPASFCNVVGLRPSMGRVPTWPTDNAWETTSTAGPMARTVDDLSLLLSVIAGPDARVPLALGTDGAAFDAPGVADLAGLRVACSTDLGGAFAVDHAVADVLEGHRRLLVHAGAVVRDAHPTLTGADETFRTLRAWLFWHKFHQQLATRPEAFKPSLAENIRAGEHLTGEQVADAYERRTRLTERMHRFFVDHDVLVLPVSQVPPFGAEQEFPTRINGVEQASYLDWMRSAYLITVTGCPAISVPAGFTPQGWPVGVQIVAAPNQEVLLLRVAAAVEALTEAGARRPVLPSELP
ncbi:MAG TPA: amidase family protein [Nocardioidaceae bacterium]|nr:amidase family protein [Nocardioidaceae bacterium]